MSIDKLTGTVGSLWRATAVSPGWPALGGRVEADTVIAATVEKIGNIGHITSLWGAALKQLRRHRL